MIKNFVKKSAVFLIMAAFIWEAPAETLRIIETASDHNLNPHITSFSYDSQILEALYEGLFSYDPRSSNAVPALATKYVISRDKKRWTFTLRENAAFSNNTPITSMDVRNSWIQLLKTPGAPYASLLDIVEGAREFRQGLISESEVGIYTTGPYSLTLKLTEPAAYLPNLLCHHTFAVIGSSPTVYSGAYQLEDFTGEMVQLKKNPFYWDAENVKIDTIEFYKSMGAEENAYAYNTGIVQWLSTGEFSADKILNRDSIQLSAQFGTEFFFFRTKKMKPGNRESVWDNASFRLALLEGLPWEILRENEYFPATHLVPSVTDYPEINGFANSDLAQAKFLMNDARKEAGIGEDQIIDLKMDLSVSALTEKQEQALREVCKELKINPIITYTDFLPYMTGLPASDGDIAVYSWIGDYADPLSFLDLFRSDSTLNASGWENKAFDELLKQSSLCNNATERYKLLGQAEQILMDDGIVIPVCTPVSASVINLDEIGGWSNNVFNLHPLKYLYKKQNVESKVPNIVKR